MHEKTDEKNETYSIDLVCGGRTRRPAMRSPVADEARREFEKTIEAAQASPIYRNAEFRALEELKRLPGN